jgi:hypothetical protein
MRHEREYRIEEKNKKKKKTGWEILKCRLKSTKTEYFYKSKPRTETVNKTLIWFMCFARNIQKRTKIERKNYNSDIS